MPNEKKIDETPWELWRQQLKSESTRKKYPYWLAKLLKIMKTTPETIIARGQEGAVPIWNEAKRAALKLPQTGAHQALNALRNFDRFFGIYPPADRIPKPDKVKDIVDLTWEQAQSIIAVAAPPFNLIFDLNLHCGWGNQEFLRFNTTDNWEKARAFYNAKPDVPYFRYNFPKRKTNPLPYYTEIPRFILKRIFESKAILPFETKKHKHSRKEHSGLDLANYANASTYLAEAFREAKKRAGIKETISTVHDLRDAFDTYGSILGVPYEIREFATGHKLDPRLYDKCWNNEPYVWNELSKIYRPREA